MKPPRYTIHWPTFLASLLLVLSIVCTIGYAVAGPRVPWPSISLFYIVDLLALVLYGLAREVSGR
ncbi:hypothetical protein [Schaalia hyovaginalis]|uniref:hypothetical protein n=1 Tax=Schaalia hyovaginalis TaxID=29316 RepID=UPI0026F1515A|nr:hypothetical protein [Schaalia hyovaginalis]MCI6557339.1 hypothetical protein [Schaalia hyovaginalis]MDY3094214.1 hypothetical protein [Schaalia hyovaginalis]MDY3664727.1 hypothetical protein [Schaalia hyovaginalis]